jgi:hypothetical protein
MLANLYDAYDGLRNAANFTEYMKQKLFSLYRDSNFYSTCQTASVSSTYMPVVATNMLKEPPKHCDTLVEEIKYVKPLVHSNLEPNTAHFTRSPRALMLFLIANLIYFHF